MRREYLAERFRHLGGTQATRPDQQAKYMSDVGHRLSSEAGERARVDSL
jgi:hypothetical protein